jgi:lysophospholipase L1-like esterase
MSPLIAATVASLSFSSAIADVTLPLQFDAADHKSVPAYTVDAGVGFDIAPTHLATGNGTTAFVSDTPFRFSARVPEGNYRVTVTLANPEEAGDTTIKAEARRLIALGIATTPSKPATRSFLVNVRRPLIDGTSHTVKLDANREDGDNPTWDDKLTLEFNGTHPGVSSIRIEPAAKAITVYIAGDSTVCDQAGEPWTGWGQVLPVFFKPTVAVANYAQSGKSLASFKAERRLEKVLSVVEPGDYLFIQFGHNDQKAKGEGVGPFTSYKKSLEEYVSLARAKGATPVLVTSMYRRRFDKDGKLQDSLGDYPTAVRQVAAEQKVALIDLHEMSGRLFQALGEEGTKKAFVFYPANTFPGQAEELKDNSHFSPYGGHQLARCVIQGIRNAGLPLAAELVDDRTPFDPAKPDAFDALAIPTSPTAVPQKPAGS